MTGGPDPGSGGGSLRMLMLIVKNEHKEKVEATLTERRVFGYTEIPTVYGLGATGMRLGSRAFPETSSIIFTVVEKEKVDEMLAAIDESCSDCRAAMRMIVWDVERMI
jgi:hypothetical protein